MTVALFYDLLFILPLSVSVGVFAELTEKPGLTVFVTIIAVVYELLIKHKKAGIKMILAGLGATVILGAVFYHPAGERISFIISCVWIGEIFLVVLASIFAEAICVRYKFIRIILSAAGIGTLCFMLVNGWVISGAMVISVFFYLIVSGIDLIQFYSKKEGDCDEKKHLAFVSPFIIVIFAVASLLHSPDEPYDWAFVYRIMDAIETRLSVFADRISSDGWDSNTPLIGFSDRGNIGGNLGDSGYTVMEIKTNQRWGPCIYLNGREFDLFDGRSWYDSGKVTENAQYFDTIETYGAILDICGDGYMSDMALKIDITMQNINMNTDRVFVPSKVLPGISTNEGITKFAYYRLNLRSEKLKDILYNGYEMTEDVWDDAVYDLYIQDSDLYTYDEYLKYRENIYDTYLGDITISEKVREYADAYIGDASSDYEKLLKIEEMFDNFNYTLMPGELPAYIDNPEEFLDYFLLEKREGYCSYYATAFVLLARAYGIPARYVQGYRIKTNKTFDVEISSGNAHAWPECYIDGIGWMLFEPTPGFGSSYAAGWITEDERIQEVEEYEKEQKEKYQSVSADQYRPDNIPVVEYKKEFHWKRIVIPVICGILFTLLLLISDRIIRKRKYEKLDIRGKGLWQCRRNMNYLRRKKLGINGMETISEYRERLSEDLPEEVLPFFDLYEQLLYSDKNITEEELDVLENCIRKNI